MTRSILEIDLSAIKSNYKYLQNALKKGAKAGAAVKADCYGLGVYEIAPVLYGCGCRDFFVANYQEAIDLRLNFQNRNLDHANIYVFSGVFENELDNFIDYDLIPVLSSEYQINIWHSFALKLQKKLQSVIHLDTGMSRLGMEKGEIDNFDIKKYSNTLDILYVMSHLASAEEFNNPLNEDQRNKFELYCQKFPNIKRSLANSNGIFLGNNFHYEIARPGAAIYGLQPEGHEENIKLPLKVLAPILQLRQINPGDAVGYNASFVNSSKHKMRIATIAIGYADGIHRALSNIGCVYINGHRAEIVGKVSMDLITINVTKIPEKYLNIGAYVEIIGYNNTPSDIAKLIGTNYYEVITSLGSRFEKKYIN